MVKVIDKCKLDVEEIKKELMYQIDEYRMSFDKVLNDPEFNDKQRLITLQVICNYCVAITNFLSKIGIEMRLDDGGTLGTSYVGYYMAKIMDVEFRVNKAKAAL